jgi:hypothetical protein
LINMAHIKVEGIGGLGMVAAVVVVAIADPRIGMATIAAAVLGVGLALLLIVVRRNSGALPFRGDDEANGSTLRLDGERRRTPLGGVRGTIDRSALLETVTP